MILRIGIVFLCAALAASAQGFVPSVRVNTDASGTAQRAPVVRAGADGIVYVTWVDGRTNPGGDVAFTRSLDGGRTFEAPRYVSSGGKVNADFQRRVNLAVDRDGDVHLAWLDTRVTNQPDVFYSRSTDRGATFSAPVSISDDSALYAQDFPSIAAADDGTVYVCFLDSREVQTGRSTNVQLYFRRSTDRGATFTPARRITFMPGGVGGTCECCATDIAAGPDGMVAIAFRSNIADRRDIFLLRSFDRGATFDAPVLAQSEPWYIPACPVTGPRVAFDATGGAHVVWRDSRPSANGHDYAYHTVLPRTAAVCLPDTRLSDTPNQSNYPDVALLPDGAVVAVYQDVRGTAVDLRSTASLDGTSSFLPSVAVDTSSGARKEYACLAVGPNGARYLVWQDGRRDAGDIRFAVDTSALDARPPGPVTLISPSDGERLASFAGFSWSLPANTPGNRYLQYRVSWRGDASSGDTVVAGATSVAPALPEGEYVWSVRAGSTFFAAGGVDSARFFIGVTSDASPTPASPEPGLSIYPNPVRSGEPVLWTVRLRTWSGVSSTPVLTISDRLGRLRVRISDAGSAERTAQVLSTRDLPPGVYLAMLRADGSAPLSTRFVVIR